MWAVLFLTLPSQPSAVRVHLWRALKALGSPLLRDGAYLLPSAETGRFRPLVEEAKEHGGRRC